MTAPLYFDLSRKDTYFEKIQRNNQAENEKIQTNNWPKIEKIQRNNGFGRWIFGLRPRANLPPPLPSPGFLISTQPAAAGLIVAVFEGE